MLVLSLIIHCSCTIVNVTINGTFTNCTEGDHPICPNLTYALREVKLPSDTTEVNFYIYNEQYVAKDPLNQNKYSIPSGMRFNIIGKLMTDIVVIQCDIGVSLTFQGRNEINSTLGFESIIFDGCGLVSVKGLVFSGLFYVGFKDVQFTQMSGIQLLNINAINIKNCTFIANIITPNAALLISYQSYSNYSIINNITIEGSNFMNNVENRSNAALEGSSGVIVLSIINMTFLNLDFTLNSSKFYYNRMPLYADNAPMVYISQLDKSNVTILVKNCTFQHNFYSILTKLIATSFEKIIVTFHNNTFLQNTDPFGNFGILRVQITNPEQTESESVNFYYSQNIFRENFGMSLYIKSIGFSNHFIQNCSFTETKAYESQSHILYITGTPNNDYTSSLLYTTNIILDNITVADNYVRRPSTAFTDMNGPSIIFVRLVTLLAQNLNLTGGNGALASLLTLMSVNATFNGTNSFYDNIGTYGGALAIGEFVSKGQPYNNIICVTVDTVLSFKNNTADYGGAVYIDSPSFTQQILNNSCSCFGHVNYLRNHARVAGHSVFYNTLSKIEKPYYCEQFLNISSDRKNSVATAPVELIIPQLNLQVFAGQKIMLNNVTLIDALHQSSSCKALFQLQRDTEFQCNLINNEDVEIIGPPTVFLSGSNSIINTQLHVAFSDIEDKTTQCIQIKCINLGIINSDSLESSLIYISFKRGCPIGFTYDNITKTCQCSNIPDVNFKCSLDLGVACIKKGYWVQQDGKKVLACGFPHCKSTDRIDNICSANFGQDMIVLPFHQDDQCASNGGGIRCSRCRSGYNLTFEGVQCTSNCKKEYPYLIILFAICIQFFLVIFVLAVVRLKLEIGSGFLYGPLIFLSIASQLPYGYFSQFTITKVFISIYTSIFLLNLEVLGEIPWCFWSLDPLFMASFYYLGPILVWIMLMLLVCIGRCCPRLLSKIQKSPVQAICLLMMLSFWSITKTSIGYLKYLKVGDNFFANVDPSIRYFTSWHVLFVLIAIVFIAVVIVPFIGILGLSNSRKMFHSFHMHRLKPLLDEFQSCYHDNCRWYCVIYYITWILYIAIHEYPLGAQMILMLILSLHFVFQPYKKRILNIIDMLLLLDLLYLTSILNQSENLNEKTSFTIVSIHIMTALPLIYISLGFLGIIVVQLIRRSGIDWLKKGCLKYIMYQRSKNIQAKNIVEDDYMEREPLISALQNEANEY